MIRVDGSALYRFIASLPPLKTIRPEHSFVDIYSSVNGAWYWLDVFLNKSIFEPRTSYEEGHSLLTLLKEVADKGLDKERDSDEVGHFYTYRIHEALRQFETVLLAELRREDIYLVSRKRGYENEALIDNATVLFPPDLARKVPEATFDIQQAGRCIAFELSTAAGLHLLRGYEVVLHRYYDAVTQGAERPEGRNIGDYIKNLVEHGGSDEKLITALKGLKDFYRNPLIHPEESLDSIDDAIALMNLIQTVIVQMLKAIPEPIEPIPDPTLSS